MKIAVPKESMPEERRVGLAPEGVGKLVNAGFQVAVAAGAGSAAFYRDELYREAGAAVVDDVRELYGQAEIIVKVQRPLEDAAGGFHEADLIPEGAVLVAFLQNLYHPQLVQRLAERRVICLSMDAIPRIARAQSMDALSSQSNIAGYKAVLMAAGSLGKYFPLLMTAAGTVPPARGLILGAGVAGLQAIATAGRLGAVVEAFDVREAVREQVESLGASFVEVEYDQETEDTGGYARELTPEAQKRQREKIHERIREADFVISTAQIPGRDAPTLITREMVPDMQPGAVIVDVAAETGGNCELTQPGKTVVEHDVTIHGPMHLPSSMPTHASQLYSRNVTNLLLHMAREGELVFDFDDAITAGCCVTHGGEIRDERTRALLG